MGKTASRRLLLLRFTWARAVIAVALGPCLTCVFFLPAQAHALDPNKRITQYMHTSWRIQDGSLPAGMYHITQTPDGFIWLSVSFGKCLQVRWHQGFGLAFSYRSS